MVSMVQDNWGGHVVSMVRGNRRTSGKYGTMQ